jgi:hypothetical protein
MKKNRFIIVVFPLLLVVYLMYKYFVFFDIRKNINLVDSDLLYKYSEIYVATNNKYPKDIMEFKEFVKKIDAQHYKDISQISLKSDSLSMQFYHIGYDGEDDFLDEIYSIKSVNFFESIFKKGDIIIPIIIPFDFKYNHYYLIEKNNITKGNRFNVVEAYKSYLNCDELLHNPKELLEPELAVLNIKNGQIYFVYNSFNLASTEAIKNEIMQFVKNEEYNSLHNIKIKELNIESFECIPAPASL